jgi:protein SCO1/2
MRCRSSTWTTTGIGTDTKGGEAVKYPAQAVFGVVLLAAAGAGFLIAAHSRPAIRGAELENFHLLGPTGRVYSIESFPTGSVLAIYFGYTTCLRACPTALNDLAAAIDRMGKRGASVHPVFIDMDPDRAALVGLPAYMEVFGPSFLGLTGSSDDIERAAKSFKVEVERTQLSADPTDYVMNHTSPIFVMRPEDPHPKTVPATSSPAAIEAALRSAL